MTDRNPNARQCACVHGAPCDGPTRSYRRAEKHGAAVVTSQPSHWESTNPDPKAPQGAYTGPLTWADGFDARGNPSYRADAGPQDHTPLTQGRPNGPDPLDPTRRVTGLPFATFISRRTASILTVRDAAQRNVETVPFAIAMPTRRSRRATLNTTVKHGADRAMDIADHYRSLDRCAATPPTLPKLPNRISKRYTKKRGDAIAHARHPG